MHKTLETYHLKKQLRRVALMPLVDLFGGSGPPPASKVIDYITISTTGNAVKFGELTEARFFGGACSSSTNGVFVGGYSEKVTIDYVKIATEGDAVDFGDLPDGVSYNAAVSNAHGGL